MGSTIPETGEPATAPKSVVGEGEDSGAQDEEAKPITAAGESAVGDEDSRAHDAEPNPTGQVAVASV